jgi:hypothetical protein
MSIIDGGYIATPCVARPELGTTGAAAEKTGSRHNGHTQPCRLVWLLYSDVQEVKMNCMTSSRLGVSIAQRSTVRT